MRNKSEERRKQVLVACQDVAYGAVLAQHLESAGHATERSHDSKGVLRSCSRKVYEAVLLDLALGSEGDIDLVSFIRRQSPATRIILLFDVAKMDLALEGIRRGAYFYLPRDCQPSDVALAVGKALRSHERDAVLTDFQQNVFEEMAGANPAMTRVIELITKVSPTDSTVLLLGESGTGKEVVANTIHRLSARRDMAFVAVNCAALTESLLESELFGYVKGAFTGADGDKRGLFEEADGGTIFLDEIGDMSLITQAKLLRVLQSGEIRPVGASTSRLVDVRVIAATNRDLVEAVAAYKFREDLYFRLNVIQIRVPPLRERMDALPALIHHFLARFNTKFGREVREVDDEAMALLRDYDYPGNVRQLESIIEYAVIMCDSEVIGARDLPDQVRAGVPHRLALPDYSSDDIPSLQEMEEQLIRSALDRLRGNQTETAKRLGVSRSTLWRKMKEYGIASS